MARSKGRCQFVARKNKGGQGGRSSVKGSRRAMRQKMKRFPDKCQVPPNTLHFGSMNVRGLDVLTEYAVHEIIKNRQLDVSNRP